MNRHLPLPTFTRRAARVLRTLGCIMLPVGLANVAPAPAAAKPNVIIIVSDDHGYADLGVQGATDIKTPHIDSLAKNGIRFTQGYVTAPLCGPSRAGLLTGRYQTRFGYEANSGPRPAPNFGLPPEEKTLAKYLKGAGYATGAVGKWHLGQRKGCRPTDHGFDEFFGFYHGARSYFPQPDERPLEAVRRGDTPVTETEYLTYAFNREACSFIDRHTTQPFFLYLAYSAIHSPMDAAPGLEKRFPHIKDPLRLTMATMMAAMDDGVGQVLETLRKHQLEEKTLVVFLSDNGGPTGNNASRNTPLRGSKSQLLEGGIRIPFLLQWKGRVPAGRKYENPIIALDLLPTALAAAGTTAPPQANLEGVNLLPYLAGDAPGRPHNELYWRMGNQYAVRSGDWKLFRAAGEGPKLVNLAEDLREQTDLTSKHPEIAQRLQTMYDEWNKNNIPPKWRDSRDRAGKGGEE